MKPVEKEVIHSALGLNDIFFILFRHKWKILLCTLAGLAAAATVYFLTPRDYESRAKLLVRYVVERSAIDPLDPQVKAGGNQTDTVINSEVEILTSLDLAAQVAEKVDVDRFSSSSRAAVSKADVVNSILNGLTVTPRKGSNVISVAHRNRDPELARTVLEELVTRYFDKHLEVHRSIGAFEFVGTQTDQIRSRLRQTEDELKKLKADAGILSLADSTASINTRMAQCEQELLTAEAEFAEQQARLKETERLLASGDATQMITKEEKAAASPPRAPAFRHAGELPRPGASENEAAVAPPSVKSGEVQHYQLLVERVSELRKSELELLSRYIPESQTVRSTRGQIEELERERRALESKFPALLTVAPKIASTGSPRPDVDAARADLAAVAAKVETLKAQLRAAGEQAARLAQVGPQITQLERKKEVEETNVKYFKSSLEKARIDEALDPSKIPNISIVQKPSIAGKVTGDSKKIVLGLAGGGLGLGIGLALLIELVLNRSVRRPLELETQLGIPQLLSIPYFPGRSRSVLRLKNEGTHGDPASGKALQKAVQPQVAPWSTAHFMRSFSETIRDRLILSFELAKLTHKPKLVGITGISGGEGTTTLAGALAAAFSEAGDGKVLLVDLNSEHSEAHPFFDGKPACGLSEALEANGSLRPAAENLYLAIGAAQDGGSIQLAPKRFYALMPHFRASHFDYIIFDMPPVSRSSATLAMAGCLDKLLLVVEAEKSNRAVVKRAYAELIAAKAQVSAVLNKTRSRAPEWLEG